MTYIFPKNKKEALHDRKVQKVFNRVVLVAVPILVVLGVVKSDSDYFLIAIVFLVSLPIFKFIDWLAYNNAKQMEETDDPSKKL